MRPIDSPKTQPFRARRFSAAPNVKAALLAEQPKLAASLSRSASTTQLLRKANEAPKALPLMQRARSAPALRPPQREASAPAKASALGASLRYSSSLMLGAVSKDALVLGGVPAARFFVDVDTGRSLALRCC